MWPMKRKINENHGSGSEAELTGANGKRMWLLTPSKARGGETTAEKGALQGALFLELNTNQDFTAAM